MADAKTEKIIVHIEFSGGLELLFGKVKKHDVSFAVDSNALTLADILKYISKNMIKERPEFFMQKDTVRPGVLVLVNDTDWELEGGLEYKIKNGDSIVFISTLHGG